MTVLTKIRLSFLLTPTINYIFLWFGAAISIAELMTGALLAPLGLMQGLSAIFLGHLIGGGILYLAGLIGAKSQLSSASSSRIAFGRYGSYAFSLANMIQLVGWTAVMIIIGASALNTLSIELAGYDNLLLCHLLIGGLICFWVVCDFTLLLKINSLIILLLFICSLLVAGLVFGQPAVPAVAVPHGTLSFGAAVELNVAMSLSWMPLIADYTRKLTYRPALSTLGCVAGYVIGGSLMFTIGLGAALYVGNSDISQILLSVGLGTVALFIVVFSTVTTAFLDVYSAGISAANLTGRFNEKTVAILVGIVGTLCAIGLPMSQYENFLYFIGSIFAPLFAILITDYFCLGKQQINSGQLINLKNTLLWGIGFMLYRWLLSYDTFIGITLPVMVIVAILCLLIHKICPPTS